MSARNAATVFLLLLLALAGCSAPRIETDLSVRHGTDTAQLVNRQSQAPLLTAQYATLWKIGDTRIDVAIENRSDVPLKIVWNQSTFTDAAGQPHPLLHVGARLLDKDAYQAPTVIAPRDRLEDALLPRDGVEWGYTDRTSWGPYNRALWGLDFWVYRPLFPEGLREQARFSVRLAFESSGMLSYDEFEFTVLRRRPVP